MLCYFFTSYVVHHTFLPSTSISTRYNDYNKLTVFSFGFIVQLKLVMPCTDVLVAGE